MPSSTAAARAAAQAPAPAPRAAVAEGCASTSSTTPLMLPAWSDQSGWSSATQYETILTADIDGDGTDELIGRNAATLDVQVWGEPYQAATVVVPDWTVDGLPAPGQWLPDTAPSAPAAKADYFDPSTYATMQVANLDSDPADEIIARTYDGLQVFDYTPGPEGHPVRGARRSPRTSSRTRGTTRGGSPPSTARSPPATSTATASTRWWGGA